MKSILLTALLCASPVLTASAATRTWDGGGTNANWSNAVNWQGDTAPVAGDSLVFPVGALQLISVNDFPSGTTFGTIVVSAAYQLSGNAITLSGGFTSSAAGANVLARMPLTLAAPVTISHTSTGLLTLGDVNNNGHTLTFSNTGTGATVPGIIGGTGGVTKSGAGPLTLAAASTYSGVTTISAGTVTVSGASALGGSGAGAGNTVIAAGAVVELGNGGGFALAEAFSLAGTIRQTSSATGTHTLTGTISLSGGTAVLDAALHGKLTITGVVSGTGPLRLRSHVDFGTPQRTGTVRLAGDAPNTFSGKLFVDNAVVELAKPDGVIAVPGALDIGTPGQVDGDSRVYLEADGQISPAFVVRMFRPSSPPGTAGLVLAGSGSSAGHDQTLSGLEMTDSIVVIPNGGSLTLSGDVTVSDGGVSPDRFSEILGNVIVDSASTWTVADSAASQDMICGSLTVLPGAKLTKQGAGTLLLASGSSGLFSLAAGVAAFSQSPSAEVELNGGSLGWSVTCGKLTGFSGGGTILNSTTGAASFNSTLRTGPMALHSSTQVQRAFNDAGADLIRTTGTVSLGNAALAITFTGTGSPVIGRSLLLIENDGTDAVSGIFAGKPQGAVFASGGAFYQISYTGGTGNDVTLTVVPEPLQILRWDAGGGNGSWNVPGNWNPNAAPTSADDLVFGNAAIKAMTNNLPAGTVLKSLTFEESGYTLAGSNGFSLERGINVTAEGGNTTISGPGITFFNSPFAKVFTVSHAGTDLTLGGSGTLNMNGHPLTISGPGSVRLERIVSGAGPSSRISCEAGSTLVMDNFMLHEGQTTVNGGTLVVDSFVNASDVLLVSGTAGGRGTLNGGLTVTGFSAAVIDPGVAGPGDLTINDSSFTLTDQITLRIHLHGKGAVSADKIILNGVFDANSATLDVVGDDGFYPADGQVFHILTNDGNDAVQNTFAGRPQNSVISVGPHQFRLSYTGGSGNDITLTALTGTSVWDGGGLNNNWTNADNWVGDADIHEDEILVFPDGNFVADNNSATVRDFRAIVVGGIYNSNVPSTGITAPTLKGRRIGLTGGIAGGAGVFDLGITLRASQTFTGGTFRDPTILGAGGADLDRDIKLNGHTLTAMGDGTLDKQITGTGGVIKDGGGLTRFMPTNMISGNPRAVANTFTGTMDIRNGSARAYDAGLGSGPNPVQIRSGGHLELIQDEAEAITHSLNLAGSLDLLPSTGTLFPMNGGLGITGAGSRIECGTGAGKLVVFNGLWSGNGSLQMSGAARIAGSVANTFSGPLTLGDGASLTLQKPGNVTALAGSGPIRVIGGSELKVGNANQISDTRPISLGEGDTAGFLTLEAAETVTSLTLTGGTVQGAGLLTLDAPLTALASPLPSALENVVVKGPAQGIREWNIEEGGAEEDLIVHGTLSKAAGTGTGLHKLGGGLLRVGDASIPGITVLDGTVRGTGFTQGVLWKLDGGRIEGDNSSGSLRATAAGGTFSPGNGADGIGRWAAVDVLWNSAVTCECQLSDAAGAPGVGYDQLSSVTTVALNAGQPGGGAGLSIRTSPDYYPLRDVPMVLVSKIGAGPISGTFADLPEGATILIKGVQHRISYTGGDGNDVTLTALTGTPRRWDGGGLGLNANWTNPLNWEGDHAPRAGDDLIFPAGHAGVTVNTYAAGTVFSSVRIEAAGYTFNSFSPVGTMTVPGGITASFAIGTSTWAIPLSLATDLKITNTQSGLLNCTAAATIATNGHLLTVEQLLTGPLGSIEVAGAISGSGTVRAGGRAAAPSGSSFSGVSLSGNNSAFTGELQAFGGLRAAHANARGTGGGGTVVEPGSLLLLDHSGSTTSRSVILGSAAQLVMGGGTTLSGTLELSPGGNLITTAGSGTATLGGAILGPPAIVHPLPIRIVAVTPLRLAGSASNVFAGSVILESGTLELAKSGSALAIPSALNAGISLQTRTIRFFSSNQITDSAAVTLGSSATLDLNGFSDTIAGLDMAASTVTTGAGTLTVAGNVTVAAASAPSVITGKFAVNGTGRTWNIADGTGVTDLVVNAIVSSVSGGTINKTGAGRVTFSGNNTLTSCTVGEGSVFHTGTTTTAVLLNGGTAGGTGTVGSLRLLTPASSSGTILPGAHLSAGTASPGLLSVGQFELGANAVFRPEFTGTTRGTQYDAVNASGSITLGNAQLVLDVAFVTPPPASTIFTLISNTSGVAVNGTFNGLAQGAIFAAGGFRWQISYTGGASTRDVTLTNLPSTGITRTWDGGGADNNWSTAANWAGDVAPNPGDDLVFPVGLAAADKQPFNNYAANTTFNSVRIDDSGYTLSNGSIALNAGVTCTYTSGESTWNIITSLTQTQSWSTAGDGSLFVSVNALMSGPVPQKTLTVHTAGAAGGIRFNNVVAGALTLVKTGPGTVTFNNANTFTGNPLLLEGTLTVQHPAGLGAGNGAVTVNQGTTLALLSSSSISLNRFLILYGRLLSGGATHSITGPFAISHTATVEVSPGFSLNISTEVLGQDSLRKTGGGTLVLGGAGANPELSDVFVDAGVLQLQKPAGANAFIGNLFIGGTPGISAQVVMVGPDQIPDTATVTLRDAGAQFLTSNQNDTIGHLDMTGGLVNTGTGTLTITGSLTTRAAAASAAIQGRVTNGGTGQRVWTIEDGAAPDDALITAVLSTIPGASMAKRGAGKVKFSGNSTPGNWSIEDGEAHVSGTMAGSLNLSGGILSGTGQAGDIIGSTAGSATINPGGDPGILSVGFFNPHPTTTLRFQINGIVRGTSYDSIDALNDTATIAGELVLEIGGGFLPQRGQTFTLLHGNAADPPNGNFNGLAEGAGFVQSGFRWHITYIASGGTDIVLTCDGIAPTGIARIWDGDATGDPRWTTAANWQGDVAPSPGDDLFFPAGAAQTVAVNSFPAATTFNSVTIGGGYTLAESSTGSNDVLLLAGLSVDSLDSASVSIPLTLEAAQTFRFLGHDSNHRIDSPVNLGSAALTIDAGAVTFPELNGALSGSGSVTKISPGEVTVAGASTFTGAVSVLGGTMNVSSSTALGSAASGTTVSGPSAVLRLIGNAPLTVAENLTVLNGTLSAGAAHTFSGSITGTGTEATLRAESGGSLTLAGVLSGPSGWKVDAGSVILSGAAPNTFSGVFTVADGIVTLAKPSGVNALGGPLIVGTGSGGTLRLGAANQIPATTTVVIHGPDAIFDLAAFPVTLTDLVMTGGTVLAAGPLTLTGGVKMFPAATPAHLMGNVIISGSGSHEWTVSDGSAEPDLLCDASLAASGIGSLDKLGAGSATFTAENTIPLRVVEGLATWNSLSPSSSITLAGGTLAGTGSLQKLISESVGGIISPGSSPGILTCASATLDSSITLRMEAYGLTSGTEHDQLILDNNELALDDAILDFQPGFVPAVSESLTLIAGASRISGNFAGLPEGAIFAKSGIVYEISYTGGTGTDVILTRIDVPAPEILSFTRTAGTGPNAGSDVVLLEIQGTAGLRYVMEVSDDLATWTILADALSSERGVVNFEFLELPSLSRRYYRVRLE